MHQNNKKAHQKQCSPQHTHTPLYFVRILVDVTKAKCPHFDSRMRIFVLRKYKNTHTVGTARVHKVIAAPPQLSESSISLIAAANRTRTAERQKRRRREETARGGRGGGLDPCLFRVPAFVFLLRGLNRDKKSRWWRQLEIPGSCFQQEAPARLREEPPGRQHAEHLPGAGTRPLLHYILPSTGAGTAEPLKLA